MRLAVAAIVLWKPLGADPTLAFQLIWKARFVPLPVMDPGAGATEVVLMLPVEVTVLVESSKSVSRQELSGGDATGPGSACAAAGSAPWPG